MRDLTVVILDRPRHEELIAEVRASGARVKLITDGDIFGAIATAWPDAGVDVLFGIGGTPEGVIAAAALKCMGGEIQAQLWPRSEDERAAGHRHRLRRRRRADHRRSGARATTRSSPPPASPTANCCAACASAPAAPPRRAWSCGRAAARSAWSRPTTASTSSPRSPPSTTTDRQGFLKNTTQDADINVSCADSRSSSATGRACSCASPPSAWCSLVAVGLVLARRLGDMQRERSLDDAVSSAQIVASAGIQPLLTPDDLLNNFLPISDASRARLDQALQSSISRKGIVRLKIWNRQHWIVYSDNPLLVGRWFAGDDGLAESLEGDADVGDHRPVRLRRTSRSATSARLLAVYVPLRIDADGAFTTDESGTVIGSFEIYVPYAPIAAAIADDTRTLYLALSVGFLVLYLGLFRLMAGASRRLRRQAQENKDQATHDALTGLPNRTQLLSDVATMIDRPRQRPASSHSCCWIWTGSKTSTTRLATPVAIVCSKPSPARLSGQLGGAMVARIGGDEFVIAAGRSGRQRCRHPSWSTSVEMLLDEPFRDTTASAWWCAAAPASPWPPSTASTARRTAAARRRRDVRRQAHWIVASSSGRLRSITPVPSAWDWPPNCAAR